MSLPDFINAMKEAEISVEQILRAIELYEGKKLETKREKTRERVREYRNRCNASNALQTLQSVTDVTIPLPSSSPLVPPLSPTPLSPPLIPPSSFNPTKTGGAREKISLDDLSVDHIRDWLAKKRMEGKYLRHDENFILEQFKDYCRANNKRYSDYPAAYRNAFEWERFNQPGVGGGGGKQSNNSRVDTALSALFNV